jgi:hypothetical protein
VKGFFFFPQENFIGKEGIPSCYSNYFLTWVKVMAFRTSDSRKSYKTALPSHSQELQALLDFKE